GVKRQWCGHRGKVDNYQVGVYMGYVSRRDHVLLDFRLSLPEDWARDEHRRQECHVPEEVQYRTRHEQCLEMLDLWGEQVPHGWGGGVWNANARDPQSGWWSRVVPSRTRARWRDKHRRMPAIRMPAMGIATI